MPAGPAAPRFSLPATHAETAGGSTLGTRQTRRARHTLSDRNSRMPGVCTTCMATSGNGWRTTGTAAMTERRLTAELGWTTPGAPHRVVRGGGWYGGAQGLPVGRSPLRLARRPRRRLGLPPLQVCCPWPLSPCTLGTRCSFRASLGRDQAAVASAGGLITTQRRCGACDAGPWRALLTSCRRIVPPRQTCGAGFPACQNAHPFGKHRRASFSSRYPLVRAGGSHQLVSAGRGDRPVAPTRSG